MVCTYCSSGTDIINSRHQKRTNSIWRRRSCIDGCGSAFTTLEHVDLEKAWVVQYPGVASQQKPKSKPSNIPSRPFMRDTLFIGLYKSLQHRPSADTDASALCDTIVGRLQNVAQHGALTATAIATLSYQVLQRFDPVAATLYAAYHADVL